MTRLSTAILCVLLLALAYWVGGIWLAAPIAFVLWFLRAARIENAELQKRDRERDTVLRIGNRPKPRDWYPDVGPAKVSDQERAAYWSGTVPGTPMWDVYHHCIIFCLLLLLAGQAWGTTFTTSQKGD